MGLYDDRVLPRLVEATCGSTGMDRYRAKAIDGLAGDVVEIGTDKADSEVPSPVAGVITTIRRSGPCA